MPFYFMRGGIRILTILILFILLISLSIPTQSWWDTGHRAMVKKATEYLPGGWREFFSHYSWFLEETSIWPDTILRGNPNEIYYHYYDSEYPPEVHLEKPERGLLPWRVAELMDSLINHIKNRDWYMVLETAGIMSHYLADATMPYHTTADYNPPITSNISAPGVKPKHALVESIQAKYINELIPENLSIIPIYIDDPLSFMFRMINESYSFLDELNAIVLGEDITDPSDDRDWPELRELLTNRTIRGIWLISSMWYTAIVKADALDDAPNPKQFMKLNMEVSNVKVPETAKGFTFSFIVKDLLGVPLDPDRITINLNDEILNYRRLDLGKYAVDITSSIVMKYSGKTVSLEIKIYKSGYGELTIHQSLDMPSEERVEKPSIILREAIYIFIVIVVVAVGYIIRRRR